MSSRFSILLKETGNCFQLGSPVEVSKYAILKDSVKDQTLVQVKYKNLRKEGLSSITVSLVLYNDEKVVIEEGIPYKYMLDQKDASLFFGEKEPIVVNKETRRFDLRIKKVVFNSGEIWDDDNGPMIKPEPKPLTSMPPVYREILDQEIGSNKEDYIFYPYRKDNYWVCTCGKPNVTEKNSCVRCGLNRENVFKVIDESYLQGKLELQREEERQKEEQERIRKKEQEKMREKQKMIRAEKNRKRKEKSKAALIKITIIALAGTIITIIGLFIYQEMGRSRTYDEAMQYMEEGEYQASVELFESIEDYQDSSEMIKIVTYDQAMQYMEEGEYQASVELFESIETYKDSSEMIKIATYDQAMQYMEEGEYEASHELFKSIETYKDSDEIAIILLYNKAMNESIKEAWELLQSLPVDNQRFNSFKAEIEPFLDYIGEWETNGPLPNMKTDVYYSIKDNNYYFTITGEFISAHLREPIEKSIEKPEDIKNIKLEDTRIGLYYSFDNGNLLRGETTYTKIQN